MRELLSKLTWVDYIALVAVLRGLYVGYKSGFFLELLRLASLFVTLFLTVQMHEWASQQMMLYTPLNEATAGAVSFLALLVGIYFALYVVRAVLAKVLKPGGGPAQKAAGALIGAGRLLLLLSFFFMLVDSTPLKELKTDVHTRSLTGPYVSGAAPALYDFLSKLSPDDLPKTAKNDS